MSLFRCFSRKHGRISKGALERSLYTKQSEISPRVSTILPISIYAFRTPLRNLNPDGPLKMTSEPSKPSNATETSSLLIQIRLLRWNKNVFISVIYKPFVPISCYSNIRLLSWVRISTMTRLGVKIFRLWCTSATSATHRTPKLIFITTCHQKDLVLRENYASELHQMKILRLLEVGRTSCYQMVGHGHVRYILFQNIILLCMTNWGTIDLFRTTWTQFCRLCPHKDTILTDAAFFIHLMIRSSPTSVNLRRFSSSLQNKVWRGYHSIECFTTVVESAKVTPIQVHIQIAISQYFNIY